MKSFIGVLIGMVFSLFFYIGAAQGLTLLSFIGIVVTMLLYIVLLSEGGLCD